MLERECSNAPYLSFESLRRQVSWPETFGDHTIPIQRRPQHFPERSLKLRKRRARHRPTLDGLIDLTLKGL
jgi:hypothetical protein